MKIKKRRENTRQKTIQEKEKNRQRKIIKENGIGKKG